VSELVNPGTTPQVYTEDGRQVAAGDRVEVDQLDEVGRGAVDSGRLLLVESEKDDNANEAEESNNEGGDLLATRDALEGDSPARRTTKRSS
jgi:hypothetical protein